MGQKEARDTGYLSEKGCYSIAKRRGSARAAISGNVGNSAVVAANKEGGVANNYGNDANNYGDAGAKEGNVASISFFAGAKGGNDASN